MDDKTRKKRNIRTVSLGILAAAIATYCSYDSRTPEEIAEHYTKEWARLLNVNEEVAFNTKLDEGEPKKLDSKYGTFLVKLKETKKYLDGYKITFSVGNPSDITIPNPKVKIRWNRTIKTYDVKDILEMPKEYNEDWDKRMKKETEAWSKSSKMKEFSKQKDLAKKGWTELEFIILPCDLDEIELVEFSIVG